MIACDLACDCGRFRLDQRLIRSYVHKDVGSTYLKRDVDGPRNRGLDITAAVDRALEALFFISDAV